MKLSQLQLGQHFTFNEQNDDTVYKVIHQRNFNKSPLSNVTLLIDKELRRNRLRTTHCTTIQNTSNGRLKTLHFAREISVRPIRKSLWHNMLRYIVTKFTVEKNLEERDVTPYVTSTYDNWRVIDTNPPN